jgi:hypothetical protein
VIGVAASPAERNAVEEFFELFKTPWEPASAARRYRVAVCTRGREADVDADLVVVYSAGGERVDAAAGVTVEERPGRVDLRWNGVVLPLQNGAACFSGSSSSATLTTSGVAADYRRTSSQRVIWRIGYDLFREVATLLEAGQPVANALTPTLELHIAVLRFVLRNAGVSFVEIPPHPFGHDFICCLTHDIDFYGIRRHTLDRTLAGFAFRASVTTLVDWLRGRRIARDVWKNLRSLLSLPLVFAGWARDFWSPLSDYAAADGSRPSTFFLVPFRNRAGASPDGAPATRRAVAYDLTDIAPEVRAQAVRGAEIAVHGIDAWRDDDQARAELARITAVTGQPTAGVRMHWLYFSPESPRHLEAAGYQYDSTCGYNDAVGYRAGTAQAFRLPGTAGLMELPLIVMDTAMFYPSRMGLSTREALRHCRQILSNAKQFGGALVVNWHDRSLAPERLWNRRYEQLLREIEAVGSVWFATADDAVQWFRQRRSVRFSDDGRCVMTVAEESAGLPAMAIRTWTPGAAGPAFEEQRLDADFESPVGAEPAVPALVSRCADRTT